MSKMTAGTDMKIRLILNGKKAALETVRQAITAVRGLHELEVRVTYEAGDVARLVTEAIAESCSRIVAGGGDGTVNEVVDALMQHPKGDRPEVAIFPLGTANDFASACGISDDLIKALSIAVTGKPYWIDVIKANERHVINVASGGFGAQVTTNTPVALKNFLGGGAYTLTGAIQAINFKPYEGEFIVEGESSSSQLLVGAVCNGRQAGGGQILAPKAYINDGLMDLVALHDFPIEALSQVISEFSAPKFSNEYIVYTQNKSATWRSSPAMPINLDGEPITANEVNFDVIAEAIKMILPPSCPMLKPESKPL
ncbi:lipid kinase YegS [Shewanella colwelliana]|uniref:lipid kinase YegS n=1 Tax=Shewanella colwelliana TaxID=23 RepID=UPI0022AFBF3E|nr:lipid kinase YegS [Shewanella colwelliana]MCZ4337236.1 lipid kinase YegS [Shewanella colwelliana]